MKKLIFFISLTPVFNYSMERPSRTSIDPILLRRVSEGWDAQVTIDHKTYPPQSLLKLSVKATLGSIAFKKISNQLKDAGVLYTDIYPTIETMVRENAERLLDQNKK